MPPQSRNEFETAIICALPLEFDAVEALLDDTYDSYGKQPGDANWYRTGRIGPQNVVLTCLPEMGKKNAASVASNLQVSFPRINLALLVGICGALPFPYPSKQTELILGDVIVSYKIVEYDFGKQYPDQFKSVVKETLGGPNRTIRSFISGLRTRRMHNQLQDDLWKYLQTLQNYPDGKWQYPGASQDLLFDALYRHKHYYQQPDAPCICADCHSSSDPICEKALEADCRKIGCMGSHVPRTRLMAEYTKPHVHFGSMASADTVMKSGQHRDRLAATENVIGFEMEGAGIWDNLPCVIIKGTCDYADSHKNKTWQDYAAATAASCTKAFLMYWSSSLSGKPESYSTVHVTHEDDTAGETLSDGQRRELLDLLHFNQIDARQISLKAAQGKTCQWMLQNSRYKDWLDPEKLQDHNGFLWIKGKPGAGKSIMMKFLFQEAQKRMKDTIVISFFFNARGDALEKSTVGLYRSLLHHLLSKMPDFMSCLDFCGPHGLNTIKNTGWKPEILKQIFTLVVDRFQNRRVLCYVDALDECPEDDVRDMISLFEELATREKMDKFLVCFSSRHYPEITIKTGLQIVLEKEREHGGDIRNYIDSQLKIENTPRDDDIKTEILRKSSGIFLWVALVIPILNKEYDRGRTKALKRRLDEIPAGLHDLFLDILTRDGGNIDEMVLCMQFILFAKRPLSPEELQVALLTGFENQFQEPFNAAEVTADVLRKFILDVSKGLAEITKSSAPTVQFIHESVRDFLLKGGLNKLSTNERNVEGQGHAAITRVCLVQLGDNLSPYTNHCSLPITLSELIRMFPFLPYAVFYIIHHSNAAQRVGTPQLSFFESFSLDRWVYLYNNFQRGVSTQKYNDKTHLLYILSEEGADALIRIHPERLHHLSLRGGRFKYPLIAALYSGNNNAARALLGIDSLGDETGKNSLFPRERMKIEGFRPGRDLLSYLSEFGDTEMLRKFLETGQYKQFWNTEPISEKFSDLITFRRHNKVSPLQYASTEAIVELLIDFAQDIDLTDLVKNVKKKAVSNSNIVGGDGTRNPIFFQQIIEYWPLLRGRTFLEYAAKRGFARLARVAIRDANHSVNQTDSEGRNLFSIAARSSRNPAGRLAFMKILHEAHANPNMPDDSGRTPLHHAVLTSTNEDIILFLLSIVEIDLEHKDFVGLTALGLAVKHGRESYVQILLDVGAHPMSCSLEGCPMLSYSVKKGNLRTFSLLFNDPRCEHNATDSYGRTALFCSSRDWRKTVMVEKMMRMLLKSETVDPNLRDYGGITALQEAVLNNDHRKVVLLCVSNQSLDLKTSSGSNILEWIADLCREGIDNNFQGPMIALLGLGHLKLHWRKELLEPLIERFESYGRSSLAQLIRKFLESGDLDSPLL